MRKDELCYEANHVYRKGYHDGYHDGSVETVMNIIDSMKNENRMLWNEEVVRHLEEVIEEIKK